MFFLFFFVVPQTFCVIRIFLLVSLLLHQCVCRKLGMVIVCGGTLTCVPLRFYVRMTQGPLHACLPSAFILVHAWSKDKDKVDWYAHVLHDILTFDSVSRLGLLLFCFFSCLGDLVTWTWVHANLTFAATLFPFCAFKLSAAVSVHNVPRAGSLKELSHARVSIWK